MFRAKSKANQERSNRGRVRTPMRQRSHPDGTTPTVRCKGSEGQFRNAVHCRGADRTGRYPWWCGYCPGRPAGPLTGVFLPRRPMTRGRRCLLFKRRPRALHRAGGADRRGPDHHKRDTVLAAVKDAARRLRRWPAAILDRGCARRHSAAAGRDEETALRSNQETDHQESSRGGIGPPLTPLRAGASTASEPARPLTPKRTSDVLPKPDILISYRHPRTVSAPLFVDNHLEAIAAYYETIQLNPRSP
jgi:hypothetical protein